jgi:hypothetical protein
VEQQPLPEEEPEEAEQQLEDPPPRRSCLAGSRRTGRELPFTPSWDPGIPRRSCRCAARAAREESPTLSSLHAPPDASADRAAPWSACPTLVVASRLVA